MKEENLAADYAGDVSPRETWDALQQVKGGVLVDVRTKPEWSFVGIPDLDPVGKQLVMVEWQQFPAMEINNGFTDEVAAAGVDRETPVYFLCRSGVRSRSAAMAMTAAGYGPCYNVAGGFEGDKNPDQHRGTTNGWKFNGLPWRQS